MRAFEIGGVVEEMGKEFAEPEEGDTAGEVCLEEVVVVLVGVDPEHDPEEITENHDCVGEVLSVGGMKDFGDEIGSWLLFGLHGGKIINNI